MYERRKQFVCGVCMQFFIAFYNSYTYTNTKYFIFQSNWIQLNKLEVWNTRWNIFVFPFLYLYVIQMQQRKILKWYILFQLLHSYIRLLIILSIYDYLLFVSSFLFVVDPHIKWYKRNIRKKILFDCFNFILFRYIIVPLHTHNV